MTLGERVTDPRSYKPESDERTEGREREAE
jgi:hypothetical protein